MTEPRKWWRRRRLIVDGTFQYALLRLLVAVWIFNTAVLGWFMYYLYAGPVFDVSHLVGEPDLQIIASPAPQFSSLMILAATFGLVLVVAVGLHMSHQIAGPIYRWKKSMKRVIAGELDFLVTFRKGDYLHDVPDLFNEMLASLRERTARDVEALKAIEKIVAPDSEEGKLVTSLRKERESALIAPTAERDAPSDAGVAGPRESVASAES